MKHTIKTPQKVKQLLISKESILQLVQLLPDSIIPDGAVALAAHFDMGINMFRVYIYSGLFKAVKEGDPIPELDVFKLENWTIGHIGERGKFICKRKPGKD